MSFQCSSVKLTHPLPFSYFYFYLREPLRKGREGGRRGGATTRRCHSIFSPIESSEWPAGKMELILAEEEIRWRFPPFSFFFFSLFFSLFILFYFLFLFSFSISQRLWCVNWSETDILQPLICPTITSYSASLPQPSLPPLLPPTELPNTYIISLALFLLSLNTCKRRKSSWILS